MQKPNPKKIGEISEIIIAAELMKLGYIVSKPIGDNQRYDLIIEENNKLLKCQCKTGCIRSGSISFRTTSTRINSKGYVSTGYKDSCDLFLVYCHENNKVYRIDVIETNTFEFRLLLGNKTDDRRIERWAIDYELRGKIK